MHTRITGLLLAACLVFGAGCRSTRIEPAKSQLEIRELQTRLFETSNAQQALKAIVGVLQDEGFLVQNSSPDLGLLTATKRIHADSTGDLGAALPRTSGKVKLRKNSVIDANVVVAEYGGGCRVRVSFEIKMLSSSGKVKGAATVDDASYYQRFFSKVDKGLFLQAEKL